MLSFNNVCRPDVVLGDDLPSETKAYIQTTRAIKAEGGEMKK
jgi:hypothetical protein